MASMNRREFLKSSLGSALEMAASPWEAEFFNDVISREINARRSLPPILRANIAPESVLYGISPHNNDMHSQDASGQQIAHYPLVNIYAPWEQYDWYAPYASELYLRNQIPMISLRPNDSSGAPFAMKNLRQMKDKIFKTAEHFRNLPVIFFRFAYEMNGTWFPHGCAINTPEEFIEGYRIFVDVVRSRVPQAQFIWSPNVTLGAVDFVPFYPGSAYTNIVGLDGYDWWSENRRNPNHYLKPNLTPEGVFNIDIAKLQKLAPDRPIMISETGSGRGLGSSAWLIHMLGTFPRYKNLVAISFFSWHESGQPDWNFMADSDRLGPINDYLQKTPIYTQHSRMPMQLAQKLLVAD